MLFWAIFSKARIHSYGSFEVCQTAYVCVWKKHAKFWDKIPTPSVSLGLLKGSRMPANKTPNLSIFLQVFIASYNFQTEWRWDIKRMVIVLMLKWKMPLKYWGMIPSQKGWLGLRQAADIMVRGGVHKKMVGTIAIGKNSVQSTEEFEQGLIKNC